MKILLRSFAVGTYGFQNYGKLGWLNSVPGAVLQNFTWPRVSLSPDFPPYSLYLCKQGLCHYHCLLTSQIRPASACANCTYVWNRETLYAFQTLESSDPILHTCSFYISRMKAQSQDLPVAGSVVHQSLKNCSFLLAF